MKPIEEKKIEGKSEEIRKHLRELQVHLTAGDDRELVVWVILKNLACAHRPLRYHPRFGGRGRDLPPDATPDVLKWVERVRAEKIAAIITLMHPKEIRHYAQLELGAENLVDLYRKNFEVRHIPWEDPAHRSLAGGETSRFRKELAEVREKALRAYDELPKPVLLHCSAGQDRSSPVAAYIWANRG